MTVKGKSVHPQPVMLVSGNVRSVAGNLPVGGAARQAVKLSRALRALGVDTHIVTHRPRLRFPWRERVDTVPVHYVDSLYWLLHRKGLRRLEALLRLGVLMIYLARHRQKYDVIHIHTAATATALAGTLAGVEMGLKVADIPCAGSGVAAALDYLIEEARGETQPSPKRSVLA